MYKGEFKKSPGVFRRMHRGGFFFMLYMQLRKCSDKYQDATFLYTCGFCGISDLRHFCIHKGEFKSHLSYNGGYVTVAFFISPSI